MSCIESFTFAQHTNQSTHKQTPFDHCCCCCCCAAGLNEYLDKLGLGLLTQQLKDLDLGDLMDTPPPGVDEAIAISKVGLGFFEGKEFEGLITLLDPGDLMDTPPPYPVWMRRLQSARWVLGTALATHVFNVTALILD